MRLSGEPYLTHPMEVANILADMKLDAATIVTGILHDTVEDTLATLKQIEENFGKEVAVLVDGLTKLSKITFASQEERQAENFRKMILAMSADIRIILVRLATASTTCAPSSSSRPDRQKAISMETLELYAPLANRLGINWIRMELEDLAFKYLYPGALQQPRAADRQAQEERDKYTDEVKGIIQREFENYGLKGEVEGRAKHYFSIYRKMETQHIDFDEVYDLLAFRIVLDSSKEKECYEALSVVHSLWKPVPGRFKDYIAMPKANNYRSLHTTVIGPYGERVEIQIRTREMHEWAEGGIAAHWRYKDRGALKGSDQEQIQKLRDLFEVQQDLKDPREFMKNLKLALFPDEVYVFTPRGDVRAFPKGATPIDFAYSVHTDVGNQCVGARVNRSIVPLSYELQNGDTLEIITQTGRHPSKDWLKHAVTSRAISKIKAWIKTEERIKSIALGRDILEKEFRKHKMSLGQILKADDLKKICEEYSIEDADDLMAVIGYGKISARQIVNRFLPEEEEKKEESLPEKLWKKAAQAGNDGRVDHGDRRRHGALREMLRPAAGRRDRGLHIAGPGDERSPVKLHHDQRFRPRENRRRAVERHGEAQLSRARQGDLPGQEGAPGRAEHGHLHSRRQHQPRHRGNHSRGKGDLRVRPRGDGPEAFQRRHSRSQATQGRSGRGAGAGLRCQVREKAGEETRQEKDALSARSARLQAKG